MTTRAEADKLRQVFRVTIIGHWPAASTQADVRAQLLAPGTVNDGTPVLIDMRGVTSGLTSESIRDSILSVVAQQGVPMTRAILVSIHAQGSGARLLQGLGRLNGGEIKIFEDEAAAVDWLMSRSPRVLGTGHSASPAV